MENKNYEKKLDEVIRASMELEDTPSLELNNQLIANLYQQEAAMRHVKPTHSISIWFIPMILNFVTFSLFALLALFVIDNPYLAKLTACICGYISIAGIFITIVGVKRANIKKVLTIRIQKRGVLV